MKRLLAAISILLFTGGFCLAQPGIEVQNTDVFGPGSFAQAMLDVAPGGTISFAAGISGFIRTDSVDVITTDVTIDGGDVVTLAYGEPFVMPSDSMIFTISGAEVLVMDAGLVSTGSGPHSIRIENGGSLSLESGSYTSSLPATVLVGQNSTFLASNSTLTGANLGTAPGGILGDGSSLIRIVDSTIEFDFPGIQVNSGALEIVRSESVSNSSPDPMSLSNEGADVLIDHSNLFTAFNSSSGSYTITNSSMSADFAREAVTQDGGAGQIIQSRVYAFEVDAVVCSEGDLTILNSLIQAEADRDLAVARGINYGEGCALDLHSTIVIGSPAIFNPVPQLATTGTFNLIFDPEVNPEDDPLFISGSRVAANSPVIDQGDCSRISLTEDFVDEARLWDSPDIADASDGCDIGPYERQDALPVELTAFDVRLSDARAFLTWTVATETDNAGFEIQQRDRGQDAWREIGFVPGAGTTTEEKTYSFTTEDLDYGTYSFRLKQNDISGGSEFSPEIEVVVEAAGHLIAPAYPNPTSGPITLELIAPADQTVTIEVFDALGRKMIERMETELAGNVRSTVRLDASGWASGMYLYQVRGGGFSASGTVVRN